MRTLYPYQADAVAKLAPLQGGALLFEPGLGKTLTAIRLAEKWGVRSAVVVCPVSAISVWKAELEQEGHNVFVPRGTRKAKSETLKERGTREEWIILNYEATLDRDLERTLRGALETQLLVWDESHYLKNATSRRSKAADRLSNSVRQRDGRILLLTGTPIGNGLHDLYGQFRTLDLWPEYTSWTQWKEDHCLFGGFEGRQIVGVRDPKGLQGSISPVSIAATKRRVLRDLPESTFQSVAVDLDGRFERAYRDLRNDRVLSVRGFPEWVVGTPIELALRLQQISGIAKVDETVGLATDIASSVPVVIFYRFREEGDLIEGKLEDLSLPVAHINGDVPHEKRGDLVAEFQTGDIPVFLGQISATSTAITLTASSDVIFHSTTWSHIDYTQAKDRVRRIGQRNAVTYRNVIAELDGGRTVDHLILDALERKADLAAEITEDPAILWNTAEHSIQPS